MNQAKVIAIISIVAIAISMALVAFKKPYKYKKAFKYIANITTMIFLVGYNFSKGESDALRSVINYIKPEHIQAVTDNIKISEKLSSVMFYFFVGSGAYEILLFLLALYAIKRSDNGDFWR